MDEQLSKSLILKSNIQSEENLRFERLAVVNIVNVFNRQ